MKSLIALGAVASVLALLAVPAWSDDSPAPGKLPDLMALAADEQFVKELGQINRAEVKLGQQARRRADTETVKAYGRRMIEDHSKANDELTAIATKKGWGIAEDPSAEQKITYDRLDLLGPRDYDREFAALMVKDHDAAVALVERYTKEGKDPELKAWSEKTLPTLKHHLEMARELEKTVGG